VEISGPATGCAPAPAPGHIGTCVCPGDGCQAGVCAPRPKDADTKQTATIKGFIAFKLSFQNISQGKSRWVRQVVFGKPLRLNVRHIHRRKLRKHSIDEALIEIYEKNLAEAWKSRT